MTVFPFSIGLKRMKHEGGRDWCLQLVECSCLPQTVPIVPRIHYYKKSDPGALIDTMADLCPLVWIDPLLGLRFDWILYYCWRKKARKSVPTKTYSNLSFLKKLLSNRKDKTRTNHFADRLVWKMSKFR